MLSFVGASRAETLPEAVQSAITAHPSVKEAFAVQQSLHQETRKERSRYFPTITASTAVGRVYGDNATSRGLSVERGAGYSNLWEGSAGINQLLFDGFKTSYMVNASRAREQAAEASLHEVRNILSLETALSYLKVSKSRESLNLLKKYQSELENYKTRIASMLSEGGSDKAEEQEAELVMLQLQNLLAGLEGQMQRAEAEYKQLTGHMPPAQLSLPNELAGLPKTPADALNQAAHSYPQLLVEQKKMKAAELTLAAQKSALYPDLTAEVSMYQKDVDDLIGGEVEDNRALVRASWDLSTGGAEFADIRKAKYDYAQAEEHKKQVILKMEEAIYTTYADMSSSDAQREILTRKVTSEQELLEAKRLQFEGGKVRIIQLLQSENSLLKSRLDLLEAQYRFLASQYSVLASMGRMAQVFTQPSSPQPSGDLSNAQ